MKERPVLCKPVPNGMTEQEKAEKGLLYNPNTTTEMASYRFKIQDAIHEYNQFRPSQVQERRISFPRGSSPLINTRRTNNPVTARERIATICNERITG